MEMDSNRDIGRLKRSPAVVMEVRNPLAEQQLHMGLRVGTVRKSRARQARPVGPSVKLQHHVKSWVGMAVCSCNHSTGGDLPKKVSFELSKRSCSKAVSLKGIEGIWGLAPAYMCHVHVPRKVSPTY